MNEISPLLTEKIKLLEEKYAAMGQDMTSYLDGLLYADYLTYWDYIQLDILLSLQHPKTSIPDEKIFILYHQITELYFKLILEAIARICQGEDTTAGVFKIQLERMNDYMQNLIRSYEIMIKGMDKDEFLKFRMALLPASGFQSAQFRKIEICSTHLIRLVYEQQRHGLDKGDIRDLLEHIYWRSGATELATGRKTLTLKQFEKKYMKEFLQLAEEYRDCNLEAAYCKLSPADQSLIAPLLKEFDLNMNVRWPLMHYRSAVRYLHRRPEDIAATGGTNWQHFLPPRNKRIVFFPGLWTDEELENWGKAAN